MLKAFRAILLVSAGWGLSACFDFDKYDFEQEALSNLPGAGGAGAGGTSGSGGMDASACRENLADCPTLLERRARGASCQSGIDCNSGFCVDGVCCEEACDGVCVACNLAEQPGFCLGIANDDSCATDCLPSTACVEYRLTETAVGGNCASSGQCRAGADCARFPLPQGTPCGPDMTGVCSNTGVCEGSGKVLGEPCETAEECAEGFCAPTAAGTRVCCDQECTDSCQQCSTLGNCTDSPATDARCEIVPCAPDDVCNDYPPTPQLTACAGFGACVGQEVCEPVALRPASECSCGPSGCSLVLGATCSSDDECGSGVCAGGLCCDQPCDGTCERCDASGECSAVADCECAPGDTTTCGQEFGSRGDCAGRTITCGTNGRWPTQQCNPTSAELCNDDGRDEDCNGDPRNGCQCLNGTFGSCGIDLGARGVCAQRGGLLCANGRWPSQPCNPQSDEVCGNNLDDDCDGNTDEQPPCNVFDPRACQFPRPQCEDLRCSRCNGCQDCADIVDCVGANPSCVTAADPVCGANQNRPCFEQVQIAEQNTFEDFQPIEAARDYITCSCTR